jgi:cell division protein ZapA (FtsZ GTPase activity inhibitor)
MTYEDVFELAVYDSGVRIDNVGDLDNLEAKLVDNHKNCKSTVGLKEIDEWVLDTIEEDAVCADFNEEVIRKAADEINSKIAQYQDKFPNKGLTEILSFMALNVCMNNIILQKQALRMKDAEESLAKELERYLHYIDKSSR